MLMKYAVSTFKIKLKNLFLTIFVEIPSVILKKKKNNLMEQLATPMEFQSQVVVIVIKDNSYFS